MMHHTNKYVTKYGAWDPTRLSSHSKGVLGHLIWSVSLRLVKFELLHFWKMAGKRCLIFHPPAFDKMHCSREELTFLWQLPIIMVSFLTCALGSKLTHFIVDVFRLLVVTSKLTRSFLYCFRACEPAFRKTEGKVGVVAGEGKGWWVAQRTH